MAIDDTHHTQEVVDLTAGAGSGPLWSMASDDLNATLLQWPPGHEIDEHVNAELDVLVVVIGGSGTLTVDGQSHALAAGGAILVRSGARRRIVAGSAGLRYMTVHRRRGRLQIQDAAAG